MQDSDNNSKAFERGSTASLIENFEISGLHGYRTLSLTSPYSATILIARNGSGKTTLLGALDAFLKAQFSRLRDIPFDKIKCKLRNVEEELVLTHEELTALLDLPAESEIARFAHRISLDPAILFRFLSEEYDQIQDDYPSLSDTQVYGAINKAFNYATDVRAQLNKLMDVLHDHNPRTRHISSVLKKAFKDIEILYLPTYRRIEVPLYVEDSEAPPHRRRKPKVKLPRGIFAADIQFGLQDISDRLRDLNQQIVFTSNRDYRQISADIINELIDGTFEKTQFDKDDIPSKQELKLFFSRLRESRDHRYYGPFDRVSIPDLDKLESRDGISSESTKFLNYFLNKLGRVTKAIREIESPVEDFITNCNKYLSQADASVVAPDNLDVPGGANPDNKELILDRRNLSVHAISVPWKRKIALESLSSGEKQMVSLFAKLYLYPKQKIVLIDEPELSLSMDWQRQILPDVISAPACRQVIAITHSPFVFDNCLEPFARSLQLHIKQADLSDGAGEGDFLGD